MSCSENTDRKAAESPTTTSVSTELPLQSAVDFSGYITGTMQIDQTTCSINGDVDKNGNVPRGVYSISLTGAVNGNLVNIYIMMTFYKGPGVYTDLGGNTITMDLSAENWVRASPETLTSLKVFPDPKTGQFSFSVQGQNGPSHIDPPSLPTLVTIQVSGVWGCTELE
ncbi:hypothetical protein KSD_07610 [Ktedonobacter sp. SOSP1-85]|nr:hypothetical protein KSD_07610 [Ktedonobacter sp. SOSP1-85]